jgi:putative transposase
MIEYKVYPHNPPHLFLPNGIYFITGATLHKIHYLKTDAAKEQTYNYMQKSFSHYGWHIHDWVILDNHYHIMAAAPQDAASLPHVINNFHRFSGLWIKKHLDLIGEDKIWHNYWDTCVDYEASYYARIHYLWFNSVKHGYVDDPKKWRFGSCASRHEKEIEPVIQYPIDKLKIQDDF